MDLSTVLGWVLFGVCVLAAVILIVRAASQNIGPDHPDGLGSIDNTERGQDPLVGGKPVERGSGDAADADDGVDERADSGQPDADMVNAPYPKLGGYWDWVNQNGAAA